MKLNIGMPASMEDILKSREDRVAHQRELLEKYKKPIISLTINIPGDIKLTKSSIVIFDAAISAISSELGDNVVFLEKYYHISGCQAYYVVDMTAYILKKKMCLIEESHFLGRLMDADVIDLSGRYLSRKDIGVLERRCLICDEKAAICARSRRHSTEELLATIDELVAQWEKTI